MDPSTLMPTERAALHAALAGIPGNLLIRLAEARERELEERAGTIILSDEYNSSVSQADLADLRTERRHLRWFRDRIGLLAAQSATPGAG